jgi:hypothetical protein
MRINIERTRSMMHHDVFHAKKKGQIHPYQIYVPEVHSSSVPNSHGCLLSQFNDASSHVVPQKFFVAYASLYIEIMAMTTIVKSISKPGIRPIIPISNDLVLRPLGLRCR